MKNSTVYTFSASTETDKVLVEEIKLRCMKQGKKFSFHVLQALIEYEKSLAKQKRSR